MDAKDIKDLRAKFGLSQEKFARRLGVSFVTVNNWESGRTKPSDLAKEKLEQLKEEVPA